ncbi:putative ribonuclease H-like domain-containing protein [Tanacetum coccineum]|uniref:Ribonuclease H-like domain-containing protein n=1 Tax=Tanacetum coccineum TaxID=301880 RepID=A0ABQ5CMG3_9ASTR
MTGNKSYLSDYEEIDGGFVAFGGDPKGGRITGKGKIRTGKLDFEDLYFVKELKFNLFSVSQMYDKKNSVLFTDTECVVLSPDFKLLDENHVFLRVPRKDNMYNVDLKNIVPLGGRKHALSFMRPFGCPVTILNTLDHLSKFDGKDCMRVLSEETPNIVGNGPNWLFDIDALTISINYKPVVAGNQTNGNAGTKENIDVGQDGNKIVLDQKYILLPLLTSDPSLSRSSKDSLDAGLKPLGEEKKIDFKHQENEDSKVPNTEEPRVNQDAADIENNVVAENIVYGCIDDPNMPNLEENGYFDDDKEVGAGVDMNNLATNVLVSPILTTRVHKDHPLEQIVRDIHLAHQTKTMTKNVTKHVEPKKVIQALTDPSWIEKQGKTGAQGYIQEEGIDYDEVFAPVARIEANRLFLAYASFMGFIVYQMDVKSAFLYSTIEKEVYVCQPPRFEDPWFLDKVYKVEKALYGLHQAPRAWYETLSTYLLENGFRRGTIDKTLFIKKDKGDILLLHVYVDDIIFRFQVTPKVSHLHAVKRIFRYLKGQPKLGLWYPKDSPFDLEALFDNETVYKEWEDIMERAASTASILVAEQDNGNINRTQSMATLNESFPHGTGSCSGPRLNLLMPVLVYAARHTLLAVRHKLMLPGITYYYWKPEESSGFEEIIDLLNASYVQYALTVNPTISLIDKKKVIITETSIRSDLKLDDAEGIDCLPTASIFAELERMGYEHLTQKLTFYKAYFSSQWKFLIHTILQCLSAKTTAWNEFSSTMASAIICLATNQTFNFSKYIFDNLVKHLEGGVKFLMYPRFVQVFLDKQVEGMTRHKGVYVTPSHTKKVFANMKRPCKGFSGRVTPLFSTMMVQATEDMGADSATPTDSHSTPIISQPSSSKPQKKKSRRKQRKDSGLTEPVTDEAHVSTPSYDPP